MASYYVPIKTFAEYAEGAHAEARAKAAPVVPSRREIELAHSTLVGVLRQMSPDSRAHFVNETFDWRSAEHRSTLAIVNSNKPVDRRIDGYNPEFLGAKPAKAGQDY